MDKLNQHIIANINSLIYQSFAKGKTELSSKKMKDYITKKFGIDCDDNLLNELLTDNPNVESINDNKIILGTPEKKEDEATSDAIHSEAIDQAQDNLKNDMALESVVDVVSKIKVGDEIDSTSITLNESDDCYHLHNGARKVKAKYIVCQILPKKDLTESLIRCKIDKSSLFVEIPAKYFVK